MTEIYLHFECAHYLMLVHFGLGVVANQVVERDRIHFPEHQRTIQKLLHHPSRVHDADWSVCVRIIGQIETMHD